MKHSDFNFFLVSLLVSILIFYSHTDKQVSPLFQHLSCWFSVEKSGDLLSPTHYVCFYTLLFPQYCTGSTPVVSHCLLAQCCKQSLPSCSEVCDFPRGCIVICIYTDALATSSFSLVPYFNFFHSTVASYGNFLRNWLACLFSDQ